MSLANDLLEFQLGQISAELDPDRQDDGSD